MNPVMQFPDTIRAAGLTPSDVNEPIGPVGPTESVTIALFRDVQARAVKTWSPSWSDLVASIKEPKRCYPTKSAMPLIMLARLGDARTDAGSLRHEANVQAISGVALDYDGGELTIADAATRLSEAGVTGVFYTSPSSTPERPRWRLLLPTSRELQPHRHRELVGRADALLGGVLAPESFKLAQSYYIGRAGDAVHYETQEVRGPRCIDQADDIASLDPVAGDGDGRSAAAQALDDPVLAALRERGLLLRAVKMGTWAIRCPWQDEHTRETADSATVYLQANFEGRQLAGFNCQHAHCADRRLGDLLGHLELKNRAAAPAPTDGRPADSATGVDSDRGEWPEPRSLTVTEDGRPYPLAALPAGIREAVAEVVGFVQCPVALAACSALSALSLAGQALADVRRGERLEGPTSLYLLAVADSGERKTTCDGYFLQPVRDWERKEIERTKPEVARYAAAMEVWEETKAGIKARIRDAAKKGEDTAAAKQELAEVEAMRPPLFRAPRLIHADATPEALAWALARGWPSGGVMSSEAGIVFGGHGMGRDSVMRNLSLLNALWDGVSHYVERRTSESFTLAGARLTMGLAVQPETVRQFMDGTKGLARGSGFAARFLLAAPQSTQGSRLFKDATGWRHLPAFTARLSELLEIKRAVDDSGALTPPVLELDDDARAIWIKFHDDVEMELRPGGDMAEARDVASKAADNVARLAALFHLYAHGPTGHIEGPTVASAARIVGWHLYQARAFLGEIAAPRELSNARRLDAWLLDYCRREGLSEVERRTIQNRGPNPVRGRSTLDAALAELGEAGRIREADEGKRRLVRVNPALLEGGNGAP